MFKTNSPRVAMAAAYMAGAHAGIGQRRRDGQPYWVHPWTVSQLVKEFGGSEDAILAGLLHDVVEDTKITVSEIAEWFGTAVALNTWWLTDVSTRDMGNRATRKMLDMAHTRMAPYEARLVKLCDCVNNGESDMGDDSFGSLYILEVSLMRDTAFADMPEALLARFDAIVAKTKAKSNPEWWESIETKYMLAGLELIQDSRPISDAEHEWLLFNLPGYESHLTESGRMTLPRLMPELRTA